MLNVVDFGALGDGKTDSSQAIQRAIDQAAETQSAVYVPAGIYLCKNIHMRPRVELKGDAGWCFRQNGGTVLQLIDTEAECVLDITEARGCTINGISIEGGGLGKNVHGIMTKRTAFPEHEDAFRIERCRVNCFSGDSCHLEKVWCVTVRQCMLSHSKGHGLLWEGWDGFVSDNWLSGNNGAGMYCGDWIVAITLTGNRVEWNDLGGIYLCAGSAINIANCYFDRHGGPAIYFGSEHGYVSSGFTITGCILGQHVRLSHVSDVVCSANCFGIADDYRGNDTAPYAMELEHVSNSIIKDNVYRGNKMAAFICDHGGHQELLVRDNLGQQPTYLK